MIDEWYDDFGGPKSSMRVLMLRDTNIRHSTMKMEAICSSKISFLPTSYHNPKDCRLGLWIYGDSLKIKFSYRLWLQMSLSSELELLPQLQKWRQRRYVACGKRLITGGTSAALPMEVTLNLTIQGKTRCVFLHYGSSKHCTRPLNKFI
jgi:hypothetical protein